SHPGTQLLSEVSMTLDSLRHRAGAFLAQPGVAFFARLGISPNALSLIGFAGNLGAAALVAWAYPFWAGLLVLFFGLFDLWDGAVARRLERASPWGALFDSVLDRLSEAAISLGLVIYFIDKGEDVLAILVLLVAWVGSVLVSYIRARGEGLGLSCPVGFFTRPERVVVLGLGLLLGWIMPALVIIGVLSWLTAGQRFIYLWRRANLKYPR
ncbi:MAG: CDP-alcohol phosphatidyltransferase family protein, partial [Chloroflexota bacterium]